MWHNFFPRQRYITLAPGVLANLSGIRTFRVFRALRTISAVKGKSLNIYKKYWGFFVKKNEDETGNKFP